MEAKILTVYFSRSGNTKKVANEAHVFVLVCGRDFARRPGEIQKRKTGNFAA